MNEVNEDVKPAARLCVMSEMTFDEARNTKFTKSKYRKFAFASSEMTSKYSVRSMDQVWEDLESSSLVKRKRPQTH